MIEIIQNTFIKTFEKEPLMVQSPGRINLIGEHTDYNGGFVLPAAIDKKMIVGIAANGSQKCRLYSTDFKEEFSFELNSFSSKKGHWATYTMGVVSQFQQAGYPVSGFDMVFGGDIPVGAGLSSSAALECAVGFGISELFEIGIPKLSLIHYAQKAEHTFAGLKCGIMDQFASVMGKEDFAIRLDCRSLEYEYFPVELGEYSFVLVDSKVKHTLADSAYNKRQEECLEGVQAAQSIFPQVTLLRDLDLMQLDEIRAKISQEVYQRCQYVMEENQRVLDACTLLNDEDLKGFGQKMYESHEGLSKKYQVSCEELDFLVDFTLGKTEILGSRMMGGGFGGCTLNLIQSIFISTFKSQISKAYQTEFGKIPDFYEVNLGNGTGKFN